MKSSLKIYVLSLEHQKWYVGKTRKEVAKRLEEHTKEHGSSWTSIHRPIRIERIVENVTDFDEDKITKEYMAKYGIENVRGGTYVQIDLREDQIESLQTEIWASTDCCTRCGRQGHFVATCYAKTDVNGRSLEEEWPEVWVCDECDSEFATEQECITHEKRCGETNARCKRCGRSGHSISRCYAKTTIGGDFISDDEENSYDEHSYDFSSSESS